MGSPALLHTIISLRARSWMRRRAFETFGAYPLLPFD